MKRFQLQAARTLTCRTTILVAVILGFASFGNPVTAATIFESGTLGSTGILYSELGDAVPGTNVNAFAFPGVRFELNQPVITAQIGGHFVEKIAGEFFGAIIALDDANDFPNSNDLTSSDVLGKTLLTFPASSAEVFGNLSLSLDPGWYALVFGSGLFGANGSGGAVRNGMDIGDPSYIGYGLNLDWFNLDIFQNPFDNHRLVVRGTIVPEPSAFSTLLFLLIVFWSLRFK